MYETRALVRMGDRRDRRDGALIMEDTYETGSMEWNDRRINIDTYSKIEDRDTLLHFKKLA